MSKLIVVSNRVTMPENKSEAGGLAVALNSALKEKGGVWCGWSGKIGEFTRSREHVSGDVRYVTMDMNAHDHEMFYNGFCNSVLWPLFHYRLDLSNFSPEMYDGYEHVNHQFAQCVAKQAEPDDIIWAHDYHLLTFASHMRAMGQKQKIGFFLHIPFPGPEVFSALPHHMEILKALCAYDLLGFQTDRDLNAFLRCVTEIAGGRKNKNPHDAMHEVSAFGLKLRAGRFSIGIDTEEIIQAAERSELDPKTIKLHQSLRGREMLIGVDRLDYTKGLVQRIQAYHHFLQAHPEYNGKVTYVQITPTSRTDVEEYGKMREELEGLAAHINGENAEIDWVPIRYLNKSFTRDELAGFYRKARVGLVTPLRDGMNLVAKEYVASQNPEDPGVLLLSKFAGAAAELKCGALLINPYNADETGQYIYKALTMQLEDRKARHQAMMAVLKRDTIFTWTENFLAELNHSDDGKIILWKNVSVAAPAIANSLSVKNPSSTVM